jgi:hypothetical protein
MKTSISTSRHMLTFLCALTLFFSNQAGNSLDGLFGALFIAADAYEAEDAIQVESNNIDAPILPHIAQEKCKQTLSERIQLARFQTSAVKSPEKAKLSTIKNSRTQRTTKPITNSNLASRTKNRVARIKQESLNNSRLAYQQTPRERLDQQDQFAIEAQLVRLSEWIKEVEKRAPTVKNQGLTRPPAYLDSISEIRPTGGIKPVIQAKVRHLEEQSSLSVRNKCTS